MLPIIKLMRKLILSIQALFIYLFLAFPVFAAEATVVQPTVNPCDGTPSGFLKIVCDIGGANAGKTIGNIIAVIIVIAIIIALLYLLYGGIKWITSRGEKDQVEAARNHIVAAVVGLIVVFLAIFIITLVLGAFGLSLTDLTIPKITSN